MIKSASPTKNEKGFEAIFQNENFKCAFITAAEQYAFGPVKQMKRHNKTDEIFVLMSGSAKMLTFENGIFTETQLSENTAFNVTSGTWHYLAASDDAKIFVTENADTSAENTEVLKLEKPYILLQGGFSF